MVQGVGFVEGSNGNLTFVTTVTASGGGLVLPLMTTTQRDAISTAGNAVVGMILYNTTTNKINIRAAAAWEAVTSV